MVIGVFIGIIKHHKSVFFFPAVITNLFYLYRDLKRLWKKKIGWPLTEHQVRAMRPIAWAFFDNTRSR